MIIIALLLVLFGLWYVWRSRMDDLMEMDPVVVALKARLLPAFPELASVKIMKGSASYTINKHRVYICTEHEGTAYDVNMLTYVALHELAHVLSPEIGHGSSFTRTFASLLARGSAAGLYDPTKPRVENYCNS